MTHRRSIRSTANISFIVPKPLPLSKLTAGEYCMPVLGVIFLRHATNRYHAALREIEADQAAGKMPKRPLTAAELKKLAEYLWQFTMFNNADYAVESSAAAQSGGTIMQTIRMGQLGHVIP